VKIFCAIDGSRYSRWALEALQYLKRGTDASFTFLHVVNTDQLKVKKGISSGENQAIARTLAQAQVAGHALLARSEKAAPAQWGNVQCQVVKGRLRLPLQSLLVDTVAI
jgi:hypothetical protein